MTKNEARDIALAGFNHIAGDSDLISALLHQAGADVAALREMAARPEFLVFVLDFLMESDERLLGFTAAEGLAPQRVQIARGVLGGFDSF